VSIDCEFRASSIHDVEHVLALPGVYKVYRPGECSFCPEDRWVITSLIRWVGEGGYPSDDRGPRVAALLRSLRHYCTDLEYGGDNGVPFEKVTDELIAEIEATR